MSKGLSSRDAQIGIVNAQLMDEIDRVWRAAGEVSRDARARAVREIEIHRCVATTNESDCTACLGDGLTVGICLARSMLAFPVHRGCD